MTSVVVGYTTGKDSIGWQVLRVERTVDRHGNTRLVTRTMVGRCLHEKAATARCRDLFDAFLLHVRTGGTLASFYTTELGFFVDVAA